MSGNPAAEGRGGSLEDTTRTRTGAAWLPPALRHRDFRIYFAGQCVSLTGSWMQATAVGYVVFALERSHEKLGWIAFATQIPNLILAPVGGVLADRHSRRGIILATQLLGMFQALALAGMLMSGQARFAGFFALSLLMGIFNAIDMPARQAFAIEMVGRRDLPNAIALNSMLFNLARGVGPMIAGRLLEIAAPANIFMLNAASFLFVLGGLTMIRPAARVAPPREGNVAQELLAGIAFVRRHAALRDVLLNVGLLGLVGLPFQPLMPGIVEEVFQGGPRQLGYALSTIGIGSLLGAGLAASGVMGEGGRRRIVVSELCFGLSLAGFSLCRSFPVALALLAPAGASMMLMLVSTNTTLQQLVPDRMRGRVMSLYTMMLLGFVPFGGILAGRIGDAFGPMPALLGGGVCCILGAGIMAMRLGAIAESEARLREEEALPERR